MSSVINAFITQRGIWLAAAAAAAMTAFMLAQSVPLQAQTAAPDLSAKQAEVDRIQGEIASINMAAEQAVERYNQASSELEGTRLQMAQNEKALGVAATQLEEAKLRLGKRLENIYRDGQLGFLDVMLSTSSFGEFMSRFDMLSRISEQDQSDIEGVIRYRADMEQAQADLELARQRQEELLQAVAAEKSEVESQLAARQTLLAGVEGEVAQMLAAEIRQEQTAAAGSAPATGPAGSQPGEQPPGDSPVDEPGPVEEEPLPPAPPPSSGGAVSIAMQYLGVPYVWGGASPSGFDCSGLVMYVYAQMGIYLPHSAAAQYYSGTPISYSELAPGDLVFFGSPISHVGIYIGGGSMIHAPFEGAVVSITSVGYGGSYAGAARL